MTTIHGANQERKLSVGHAERLKKSLDCTDYETVSSSINEDEDNLVLSELQLMDDLMCGAIDISDFLASKPIKTVILPTTKKSPATMAALKKLVTADLH